MNDEKLLRVEEVAVKLDVSARTLDLWYRWKRRNPNSPLAELLPEPEVLNGKRMWKASDIDNMTVFRDSKPKGRGGIMGTITYKRKENDL